MKSYPFSYSWRIQSAGTPEQLWPYVSNTNRFFKDLGQLPVQEAMISHDLPRHYAQLEYNHLRRSDIWQEEPYQWEAPHYLKIFRDYERGPYEELYIKIELQPLKSSTEKGTLFKISFEGKSRGFMGALRTKRHFSKPFKRRLKKILKRYEDSIVGHHFPERKRSFFSSPTKNSTWEELRKKLTSASREPELSKRIVEHLLNGDEQDLKIIDPVQLARMWAYPLHRVLKTAYHAVILNILNLEWKQECPTCRRTLKISRMLTEISESHYCKHCGETKTLDLNNTTQIIFKSHPLIRKLSDNTYCVSGPQDRSHVLLQQYIKPGAKHFVNLSLPEGRFRVRTDTLNRDIQIKPDLRGLDNVTLTLQEGEKTKGETLLYPRSDMIIKNNSESPLLISIEDKRWPEYGVSASEVTSQQLFRDCFPKEHLRSNQKMKCDDLTILFTDLMDSSSIYSEGGDEEAISRVMDHFETLRQIVQEERGAIVKTIGDAIMAVFRSPKNAVVAYRRAQKLFNESEDSEYKIRIKGGLHCGNCYALTLNNRIDYFGNTVNLAARLVEKAKHDELVISDKALDDPGLKQYLKQDEIYCEMDEFASRLKGFGDKNYQMKRLMLQKPSLKLVI